MKLHDQHCRPMEGGAALEATEAQNLLGELDDDWQLEGDGARISRAFKFRDFHETVGFVNALAWIANREDHHPDLEVSYNRCVVHFSTHSVGGLSQNDFVCAAKADALLGA